MPYQRLSRASPASHPRSDGSWHGACSSGASDHFAGSRSTSRTNARERCSPRTGRRSSATRADATLRERLDQLDQLVAAVAVPAGEFDELPRLLVDNALLRRTDDLDPAAAAEVEPPLVAKVAQRAQDG